MTIYTELSRIQKELKAPKGQYNSFGKYKYRSCEDIMEAVKPILGECSLTVSDEMVIIGDRYYIKAIARLALSADDFVESSAYAREPLDKKGMDESQITGATSSYARKYALNGLFAIDDTKDADATNEHDKTPAPKPQPQKPELSIDERCNAFINYITTATMAQLNDEKVKAKFNALCKDAGADKAEQLNKAWQCRLAAIAPLEKNNA